MVIIKNKKITFSNFNNNTQVPLTRVWNEIKPAFKNNAIQEKLAKETLTDWVKAPYKALGPDNIYPTNSQDFPLNNYFKNFVTNTELTQALKGNVLAEPKRRQEELLAERVLINIPFYEKYLLNDLLTRIHNYIKKDKDLEDKLNNEIYYGKAAYIDWANPIEDILQDLEQKAPLERLYRKVAAIHRFARCLRKEDLKRSPEYKPFLNMVKDKWNLDETHPEVIKLRNIGVNIWAGVSGSTKYILDTSKFLGIDEKEKLAALTYCIFAFFHFMPTVFSATHTLYEITRSSLIVDKDLKNIDSGINSCVYKNIIPTQDFADNYLKNKEL